MARALVSGEAPPIVELNMTPLIDVLLVLLVMFIITLPLQTHAVKVDLPSGPPPAKMIGKLKNEVVITASDEILWNGQKVTQAELAGLFAASQSIDPNPELHLRPDADSRYDLVDQVLAIAKRSNVRNMGFVGNDAYASF